MIRPRWLANARRLVAGLGRSTGRYQIAVPPRDVNEPDSGKPCGRLCNVADKDSGGESQKPAAPQPQTQKVPIIELAPKRIVKKSGDDPPKGKPKGGSDR